MHKKDVVVIISVVGVLALIFFVWSVYFRPQPQQEESPQETQLDKKQILEALRGDTNQSVQREEKIQVLKSLRETGHENIVLEEGEKKSLLESLKSQ